MCSLKFFEQCISTHKKVANCSIVVRLPSSMLFEKSMSQTAWNSLAQPFMIKTIRPNKYQCCSTLMELHHLTWWRPEGISTYIIHAELGAVYHILWGNICVSNFFLSRYKGTAHGIYYYFWQMSLACLFP